MIQQQIEGDDQSFDSEIFSKIGKKQEDKISEESVDKAIEMIKARIRVLCYCGEHDCPYGYWINRMVHPDSPYAKGSPMRLKDMTQSDEIVRRMIPLEDYESFPY